MRVQVEGLEDHPDVPSYFVDVDVGACDIGSVEPDGASRGLLEGDCSTGAGCSSLTQDGPMTKASSPRATARSMSWKHFRVAERLAQAFDLEDCRCPMGLSDR